MNLSVTPYNNKTSYNVPSFKANLNRAAEAGADAIKTITEIGTKKSNFFKPLEDGYDKFADGIAKHFTSKMIDSKPIWYLAEKFKNSKNLFQHTLTIGSVITSGLYMQRTYTNKDLDEDRRNTLVVNQGLTLAVSTAGAYLLDKYLKGWWENVTARFAGHLLKDENFANNFKQNQEALKAQEKGLKDFIRENEIYKNIKKTDFKSAEAIMKKVNGMGVLRTMIVFGFVYRYFVPVAVTKPANKLCEMYLANKKAKQGQSQNVQKQA